VPFEMSLFGLSWVMPRRVIDLFACWWTTGNTSKCCCLEDDTFVPFMVSMKGKE
jgi:hypothetical protein